MYLHISVLRSGEYGDDWARAGIALSEIIVTQLGGPVIEPPW